MQRLDLLYNTLMPDKENHLYWVGIRESEIVECAQLFARSITFIGDSKKNRAYLNEYPDDDYNRPNSRQDQWFAKEMSDVLARDAEARFLFYSEISIPYILKHNKSLAKSILQLNSEETTIKVRDKFAMFDLASKVVPGLKREQLSGKQIKASEFAQPIVAQARIGQSGSGTNLLMTESDCDVLVDEELYSVSNYQEINTPINIHALITDDESILFPASLQIIKLVDNRLTYNGADFNKYRKLNASIKTKVDKYSELLCRELKTIGYRGVVGIDFIIVDDEVYFMEFNGRFQRSSSELNQILKKSGRPTLQELQLMVYHKEKLPKNLDLTKASIDKPKLSPSALTRLIEQKYPKESDQTKILKALEFATEKHTGQTRLSGESYISHPIAVATILAEWDMDVDTVVAGLLHDVVEDTDTSLDDLAKKFGKNVALLVDGVTKVSAVRAGRNDISTYLPSTKDNLTKLLVAVGSDIRVIIIKLADRLHNLRTLNFQTPEKQIKKAKESLEVFAPLADRLNMGRVRVEIEEISFKYIAPKRYNKLKNEMDQRLGASKKKLDKIRAEVSTTLEKERLPFEMDGRVKSVYSLHKKLGKKPDMDEIYDLIALRIIVDDISTCYLVLGLLHQLYKPLVGRIKDYISRPKANGYQALHTTVETTDGQVVEFQIRTNEMHDYAERGLAASFHYNEAKLTNSYKQGKLAPLPESLMWIRNLQEAAARLRAGEEVDYDALKISLFSDRIFVYTPRGDIFDLPSGSLPLDFAYQVHSELAAKAVGFKINGKIAKFDTPLKSGDTIEILTQKNTRPKLDWLRKIITPHARSKIRAQLRHNSEDVPGQSSDATTVKPKKGAWSKRGDKRPDKKS